MANLQAIKVIPGGKPLQVRATGVKNVNEFDLVYAEKDMQYMFTPKQGKLSAPAGSPSANNYTLVSGGTYTFTPDYTIYFGVDQKGKTAQITKKEADAFNLKQTATVLNTAADAAVKSEEIKKANIKRTALAVAGVVVLISGIASIFYFANRRSAA